MTDAQRKAAEVWPLVIYRPGILGTLAGRDPMPPGVAIDCVQDLCPDRDEAVAVLVGAAAAWLRDAMPAAPTGDNELDRTCREQAGFVCDYLASESAMCRTHLRLLRDQVDSLHVPTRADWMLSAGCWLLWFHKADRAIELCGRVSDAAWPEGVA